MTKSLIIFGFGYVGSYTLAAAQAHGFDEIKVITRSVHDFTIAFHDKTKVISCLENASHILVTTPPSASHDPVLAAYGPQLHEWAKAPHAQWLGYLSTTGVYGDHQGAWVNEATPPTPTEPRSMIRLQIENEWYSLGHPSHIFRVSGIYGPGRSVLEDLLAGTARCIEKPGQVFSRIHVADIVQTLLRSAVNPSPGEIYNLADDLPCPSHVVVAHGASLLKTPCPPLTPYEEAELSPMAKSFYSSCRRVANTKIKEKLGVQLLYPTYKEGLEAILHSIKA